jgi:hypothetical protein
MKNKTISLLFIVAALTGCATEQTPATNANQAGSATAVPPQACATNFKTEGGFFSGTKFSSFQEFPKKTVPGAFDSLLSAVAVSGYQIVSSNKDSGLISANQTVSYGKGKTVPLNVFVKKSETSGVRVEIVTNLSGGVSASAESVQTEFCKLLASVDQSANAPEPAAAAAPASTDTQKTTKSKRSKKKQAK